MDSAKDLIKHFEEAYLGLRLKESRVLNDDQVRALPKPPNNQYLREWKLRAKSANRFGKHLSTLNNIENIMEIGCGNGWFCHFLSKHTGAHILGTDINQVELEQASKLFENHQISFHYFNVLDSEWTYPKPDMIVFNASIQYFPNLTEVINRCRNIMPSNGAIHILDSPFYWEKDVNAAKQRSSIYFNQIGYPQMKKYYYHHTLEEVLKFNPTFLYRPGFFPFNKIVLDSPFPWLMISALNG